MGQTQAVKTRDYVKVSSILESQNSPQVATQLLEYACQNGNVRLVEITFQKASIDLQSIEDHYLLHLACRNGYFNIAMLLLENGVHVDRQAKDG